MSKIIDVRPDSPTYLTVVRSVQLKQLTPRPFSGVDPVDPGYERRFAANTPDGRYAFVTRGGGSKVDMVTATTGAVTTVAGAQSLTGGGHITAFSSGSRPTSRSGR